MDTENEQDDDQLCVSTPPRSPHNGSAVERGGSIRLPEKRDSSGLVKHYIGGVISQELGRVAVPRGLYETEEDSLEPPVKFQKTSVTTRLARPTMKTSASNRSISEKLVDNMVVSGDPDPEHVEEEDTGCSSSTPETSPSEFEETNVADSGLQNKETNSAVGSHGSEKCGTSAEPNSPVVVNVAEEAVPGTSHADEITAAYTEGPSTSGLSEKTADTEGAVGGSSAENSVSSGDAEEGFENKDSDKDKKKKNRCAVCRKKVGLTGFECRCGGLFCALHRYSDKHECTFDYREMGAQEIRRNNPVVVGEKIQKI